MVANSRGDGAATTASTGRRFLVGTNVVAATALAVGIVVVAQLIAYQADVRADMTSSGVNSLSEGTEKLLRGVEKNVRLTSLYFETDREDEDQSLYRRASQDLIDLYQATNRSKVRADWVNPLKDHEKFGELLARLREMPSFREEIDAYTERTDRYRNELDDAIRALIQTELDSINGVRLGLGQSDGTGVIARLEEALTNINTALESTREQVDDAFQGSSPQYSAAANSLRAFYSSLSTALQNIGSYATGQAQSNPSLPPAQVEYLEGTANRFAGVLADVEGERTKLQALEPLKYEDLAMQLGPTSNALLVETDDDARVVAFNDAWPPVQQGARGRAGFGSRAFKGEEKLTSAILRATHKEQTSVVFVRHGGTPLFSAGFMPGQPRSPYAAMKQQLEDANFIVAEWDLKTAPAPPTVEPTPTRTIYFVLKPTPPRRGPMGQPSPEPPFGQQQRQALVDALGETGRALFVAGWSQSAFGLMGDTYAYHDYLKDTWGIDVNADRLVISTRNVSPGKYLAQNGFHILRDVDVTRHDIVSGALARELGLPTAAPLKLVEPAPEGVEHFPLVVQPKTDGVWGESDVSGFLQTAQMGEPFPKQADDLDGPFPIAVAATKGDAKVVVVSSSDFAMDAIAFARGLVQTSRGFSIRSLNPGNIMLVVNSLHWLNDNTEFTNIGKPIDAAVLEIADETAVQALTIFVWPFLAIIGGGVSWWVRRR